MSQSNLPRRQSGESQRAAAVAHERQDQSEAVRQRHDDCHHSPKLHSQRMFVVSREDQYRQLWAELERLIRAHADTSPQHKLILDCVLECKKVDEGRGDDATLDAKRNVKTEIGVRCET